MIFSIAMGIRRNVALSEYDFTSFRGTVGILETDLSGPQSLDFCTRQNQSCLKTILNFVGMPGFPIGHHYFFAQGHSKKIDFDVSEMRGPRFQSRFYLHRNDSQKVGISSRE